MMNKKGNWTLPAIFGVVGIALFIDSITANVIGINRLLEFLLGIGSVVLGIWLHRS
jgi:hypothetical protein